MKIEALQEAIKNVLLEAAPPREFTDLTPGSTGSPKNAETAFKEIKDKLEKLAAVKLKDMAVFVLNDKGVGKAVKEVTKSARDGEKILDAICDEVYNGSFGEWLIQLYFIPNGLAAKKARRPLVVLGFKNGAYQTASYSGTRFSRGGLDFIDIGEKDSDLIRLN